MMNQPSLTCLILGASVRAAATSVVRAGLQPVCADQFADADLMSIANVLPIKKYPNDLIIEATRIEPTHWIYTGALENSPAIIEAVSAHHSLWGNRADVVRAVRDPFRWYEVLKRHDLPALDVRPFDKPPQANANWMLKPRCSAGGRDVYLWNTETKLKYLKQLCSAFLFQQRADGDDFSALYLASAHQTKLIGISTQLVGSKWLNAKPFSWCGNIAPVQFSENKEVHKALMKQAIHTGTVLATEFRLRGLFGVDYILETKNHKETLYPLEVNPRYVASVELFERVYDISLFNAHIAACETFENRQANQSCQIENDHFFPDIDGSNELWGKAILYASHDFTFPLTISEMPNCADIPSVGSDIHRDEPICTLFETGKTREACQASLQKKASEIYLSLK